MKQIKDRFSKLCNKREFIYMYLLTYSVYVYIYLLVNKFGMYIIVKIAYEYYISEPNYEFLFGENEFIYFYR